MKKKRDWLVILATGWLGFGVTVIVGLLVWLIMLMLSVLPGAVASVAMVVALLVFVFMKDMEDLR